MLARIQECILYRGFSDGEILNNMAELINLYESDEEALKAKEDQFFKSINGLVELAGMYGFSGNIWHTYLTFLLVNHENAFSMASEIRGAIKGSINDLAKNDFQIFKELYDFDITVFDRVFGTVCCKVICDYQTPDENSKLFNTRIRDRICQMSKTLAAAATTEEFMDDMVSFYKDFGVGKLGLHKAFRIGHDENGKVELANTSDKYKEFLKFMHKLYAEGLMEQEAFTITGEEVTTKEQGDVYGSLGCGSAPFVMAGKDISYDANWLGLSGLTSDVHSERETSIASPVQNGIMVAVNANTQYPEAMARFLDYFYTDEGMFSATKGYEGITFDMVQDELLGIEVPEMKVPDGYTSGEEYRYKGSVLNEALNLVERNLDREALFNADQELLEKPEIVEKYGWAARVLDAYKADGVTGVDCYPVVSYTTEEIEERSPIYKDLSTYLQQAKAQFITGELDVDQDWDTYVNTVEQMNAGRLLEIEQAAYDRFAALKG